MYHGYVSKNTWIYTDYKLDKLFDCSKEKIERK